MKVAAGDDRGSEFPVCHHTELTARGQKSQEKVGKVGS
jgi:hypothetical protein